MSGGVRVKAAVLGRTVFWRRRRLGGIAAADNAGNAGNREMVVARRQRKTSKGLQPGRPEQAKRPDLFICGGSSPVGIWPHRGARRGDSQLSEVVQFACSRGVAAPPEIRRPRAGRVMSTHSRPAAHMVVEPMVDSAPVVTAPTGIVHYSNSFRSIPERPENDRSTQ